MRVKNHKILVVDADIQSLQRVEEILISEQYEVKFALNGREAIEIATQFDPDIILMEIALPEMDGIEACIEIRTINSLKHTLIIFYTDRHEDYTQIAGFNAGADDYIIKPVKAKVLLKRIKAMLRRLNGVDVQQNQLDEGEIKIDRERYLVLKGREEILFPRKEFELISLLHSSPRKVFSRREISSYIWGYEMLAKNRTIDVHIRKLREKLGDSYIKTVKGIGYSFEI
jgi:two-component system alkaline phosphatase synthesis response regulator PhoP